MEKLADLKSGRPAPWQKQGYQLGIYVALLYVRSHVLSLVVPRFMLLVFRT